MLGTWEICDRFVCKTKHTAQPTVHSNHCQVKGSAGGSATELSRPAAESAKLPDAYTLGCQHSKQLAVSLSGLRRSLRPITGISARVCLHLFLRSKMNFDYYFTDDCLRGPKQSGETGAVFTHRPHL